MAPWGPGAWQRGGGGGGVGGCGWVVGGWKAVWGGVPSLALASLLPAARAACCRLYITYCFEYPSPFLESRCLPMVGTLYGTIRYNTVQYGTMRYNAVAPAAPTASGCLPARQLLACSHQRPRTVFVPLHTYTPCTPSTITHPALYSFIFYAQLTHHTTTFVIAYTNVSPRPALHPLITHPAPQSLTPSLHNQHSIHSILSHLCHAYTPFTHHICTPPLITHPSSSLCAGMEGTSPTRTGAGWTPAVAAGEHGLPLLRAATPSAHLQPPRLEWCWTGGPGGAAAAAEGAYGCPCCEYLQRAVGVALNSLCCTRGERGGGNWPFRRELIEPPLG